MLDVKDIKPENLWYIVGYITTDGCLSKDGRHVTIVSKDTQILEDTKQALGLNHIKTCNHQGGYGTSAFHINISNKKFYQFLEKIGLTSRKSLTLGPLNVPDKYFKDFLRGVNDGDGCIYSWTNRTNGYVQWSLRLISGSPAFIKWLKNRVENKFQVKGKIYSALRKERTNYIHFVKFGKMAAKIILQECYYPGVLVLKRKEKVVQECLRDKNLLKTCGNVVARVL